MLRIAIVDDEKDQGRVRQMAVRYFGEQEEDLRFSIFRDGQDFIDGYRHAYDLVFLGIEMEHHDYPRMGLSVRCPAGRPRCAGGPVGLASCAVRAHAGERRPH